MVTETFCACKWWIDLQHTRHPRRVTWVIFTPSLIQVNMLQFLGPLRLKPIVYLQIQFSFFTLFEYLNYLHGGQKRQTIIFLKGVSSKKSSSKNFFNVFVQKHGYFLWKNRDKRFFLTKITLRLYCPIFLNSPLAFILMKNIKQNIW